jgi:hypothetical protein
MASSAANAQNQAASVPDPEPSSVPAGLATETVDLLEAAQSSDIDVVARGHGQDRVQITINNRSPHRLNVIVPPGLVAAATTGQGAGGAGGRLQSMGLGSTANRDGAFGEFRGTSSPSGLQSVPATDDSNTRLVTAPVGETIKFLLPSVCLNYGLPSPTGRNILKLMDVDQYSADPRVRKALRSLATYGTCQGVAQAVMWHVCNDLSFEEMAQGPGKIVNLRELALASRFVAALDATRSGELIDPASVTGSRIFVRVQGEGSLADEAKRLAGQLEGFRVLGLPLEVVNSGDLPDAAGPALYLNVVLLSSKIGETRARIVASACSEINSWLPLGKVAFHENSTASVLDGASFSRAIDRAVAAAFVTVKPARRTLGSTTLKVENRLPFTVSGMVVKAGSSSGSPSVPFEGIGVGPGRAALLPIQAATASLVERVVLNGL